MSQTKHRYYDKRQVVKMDLVEETEFDERIILCLPRFAWRVARAYLAMQAQWESSYAVEYHTDYYISPDSATMDKILASVDAALLEEDMSCDIREGLDNIVDAINNQELIVNCCPPATGCGSGGAGATEGPASEFEDDGETPPDGFPDYTAYDAWKCGVANLIIAQIENDLEYLKSLAVTEITATLLGFALLTPIPFDDIGVLVGVIITWAVEQTLDSIIDSILTQLGLDSETLRCGLYNSLDVSGARTFLESWGLAELGTSAAFLLGFFINNDSLNRLFESGNQVLPDSDCSGCATVGQWEEGALGNITDQATDATNLQATSEYGHIGNNPDAYWLQIYLSSTAPYSLEIDTLGISGWSDHGQCPALSIWYYTGGTSCDLADAIGVTINPGDQFIITSLTEFTIDADFTIVP